MPENQVPLKDYFDDKFDHLATLIEKVELREQACQAETFSRLRIVEIKVAGIAKGAYFIGGCALLGAIAGLIARFV